MTTTKTSMKTLKKKLVIKRQVVAKQGNAANIETIAGGRSTNSHWGCPASSDGGGGGGGVHSGAVSVQEPENMRNMRHGNGHRRR